MLAAALWKRPASTKKARKSGIKSTSFDVVEHSCTARAESLEIQHLDARPPWKFGIDTWMSDQSGNCLYSFMRVELVFLRYRNRYASASKVIASELLKRFVAEGCALYLLSSGSL